MRLVPALIAADVAALDAYVIALACAGIAVRALDHRVRSLESLFLELTAPAAGPATAVAAIAGARHDEASPALS